MAARHNMRASQNERGERANIAPALSHLNQHLRGPSTPETVAALALSTMAAAGVAVDKLRKDYAQAVELLFSLPPDTQIDTGRYFVECVEWVERRFGAGHILSADVHHDEAAPHCHVLVLPLLDGRMVGSALVARAELTKMRDAFYREVGRSFGLKKAARIDGTSRAALAAAVLQRLNAISDPIMRSGAWAAARGAIERDPEPFAQALGVEVAKPSKKLRTMADVFTSRGKKTAEDRNLGFKPQKDRNLSCVGFAPSQAPISPAERPSCEAQVRAADDAPAPAPTPDHDHDHDQTFARIRDDDMAAGQWCEELGEWVPSSEKPKGTQRAAADGWVADALAARGQRGWEVMRM